MIGAGGIARRRTIPEGILPARNAELKAVMDVAPGVAEEVAKESGCGRHYEKVDGLLEGLKRCFEVTPVGEGLSRLLADMTGGEHSFGLYMAGSLYLVELKKGVDPVKEIHEEMSPAWEGLDVSILHSLILDDLLGIGKEELEKETNVAYARDAEKAVAGVDSGEFQMAFFLNPTRASQVSDVAGKGERMPQKSTDFYPKILTGFVMNKLEIL